mmetsp:Transcript_2810/g.5996  ORF Transcript_2810/g.5996 Transcript_2810/m.5996 type:complete len:86 (-) Transcript_2810:1936-2193(-)
MGLHTVLHFTQVTRHVLKSPSSMEITQTLSSFYININSQNMILRLHHLFRNDIEAASLLSKLTKKNNKKWSYVKLIYINTHCQHH